MIGKFLLTFWIILRWTSLPGNTVIGVASAHGWPASLLDESLDEKNDVEIFRAVVESMIRWEQHRKSSHRSKREASRVCYEDVGCFEDTGPFGYLEMLPSPPEDVGTRFLVYGSRRARSIPTEVPANEIGERVHRAIDPELPTKVIVHGFGSGCEHIWVYEMRSALMAVHECNVICVDWGPGSAVPNYVRAAANTRLVGRQLAKLIRSLDVPLERIHLIGFSLGAHVAGFAGAELGNVSRITGLDPAGPLFESQDPRARLDETDAHFVDVIHSNGEQLILGGLGSWQPMGDVDFYPNGGRMQTGCSNLFLGAVSDIIWSSAIEGRSLCNHRRAYKLFTDSVSPKCRFPAFTCEQGYESLLKGECFPCDNSLKPCGLMGYYSDTSPARGQLYLVTREEEPFCAHQYLIKVYNSLSERPARSYGSLKVTLVGEGTLNETFAMTKKDDEELLVGAVLKKIIVPHPAITDIEGVEVKYTAYSGWISSGLVSWSIDKIVLVDSFGQTLSVCNKGLTLESNRPVFLPLYPGECNVPETAVEPITNSTAPEAPEKFVDGQIGSTDSESGDDVKPDDKVTPNLWPTFDLSNDGNSNSLDHNEVSGRGFSSGSSSSSSSSSGDAAAASPLTLENSPKPNFITERGHSEIQEPVLRPTKKETGRSLRLGEITEPILGPRSSKRNIDIFKIQDSARRDEILEASSSSSRSFTVQFLPEKLAGILAQAERYARHTLLPLISRYTPSFVGGSRDDQPKYFPLLSEFNAEEGRSNNAEAKLEVTDETKIVKILKNSTSAEEESNTSDWVPITEPKLTVNESPETTSENAIVAEKTSDRVFIPFVNLEESEVSTSKEVASNETVVPDKAKGIQEGYEAEVEAEVSEERETSKKKVEDTGNDLKAVSTRSMIFPYVYERSKDPRTRYIPLIPEEDFGMSTNIFEKFR